MFKFYLPYGWLLNTRVFKIDIFNVITIFVNYLLPSFLFLCVFFEEIGNWLADYIIVFTAVFSLYEVGYIFNDLITIQFDDKPKYRIKEESMRAILLRNLENLLTVRLLYFSVGLLWVYHFYVVKFIGFLMLSLGLLIAYSFHNYVRGKGNALTFFVLVHFKFFLPIYVFCEMTYILKYYFLVAGMVVFDQSILYCSEKDIFSSISFLKDKIELFRVFYFSAFLILTCCMIVFGIWENKYILLPIVWFLYRLTGWMLSKTKLLSKKIKDRRNMYKKKMYGD